MIGHADAAMGGGLTEHVFLVGAVEVDESLEGIDARALVRACFETFEAEDACEDAIGVVVLPPSGGGEDGGGGYAAFEDLSEGCAGADAVLDLVKPRGGPAGAFPAAESLAAGGDGCYRDGLAGMPMGQRLPVRVDDQEVRVRRKAEGARGPQDAGADHGRHAAHSNAEPQAISKYRQRSAAVYSPNPSALWSGMDVEALSIHNRIAMRG